MVHTAMGALFGTTGWFSVSTSSHSSAGATALRPVERPLPPPLRGLSRLVGLVVPVFTAVDLFVFFDARRAILSLGKSDERWRR